ncbi:putative TonB-dependent receptor [Denitratisoma oestradiolicum]|uniref:Putative TonB-dependent receptor n=1 Tax=Denitratisoma oestradiolicum TaxID=311182 RepID=A0A6S6XZK1_9PROT|nr:putative TonB-dependent receptor [Denitratisoma oestradiolicum]
MTQNRKFERTTISVVLSTLFSLPIFFGAESARAAEVSPAVNAPHSSNPSSGAGSAVLEEVVVTAQKRQERLQDVPISITAISGAQLENRGIEGGADLSGLAPNLKISKSPSNSLISQVSIRGSITTQVAIYMDPAVGMYVDGVYITKAAGSLFELLDLERVEVLRGPQGTLFGRNTMAGAVSFVTRRPSGEWSGSVSVDVGNFNRHVERVFLDLPKMGIASISLGFRNEQADGWMKNLTGPAQGGTDRQAWRLAANFDVSRDLKVDYTFDHTKVDEGLYPTTLFSLSGSGSPGLPGINTLSAYGQYFSNIPVPSFAAMGNRIIGYAATMAGYVPGSERPSSVSTDPGADLYQRLKVDGHALTVTYDLNANNTLKYIGSARKMTFADSSDLDGTPANLALSHRDTEVRSYSQEFQWIGKTDRFNYVAGLYQFREDGTTISGQHIDITPPPAGEKFVGYRPTANAKALYGQIDYKANDALTLTAGLRRTSEDKTIDVNQWATAGYLGPFLSSILPVAPGVTGVQPWVHADATFSGTTPSLAAAYKVNEGLNFYARFAKGFKSGGFSGEVPSAVGVMTPFGPEKSATFEVGVKTTFADGRAQLNASLFQNKITDMQFTRTLAGTTASVIVNAGKATQEGLELEGAFILADGWKLQGSYGYLHAKIDEYMDFPRNAATAALAGVSTTTLINTAGNRVMPYAPRHTLNLNLDGRLAQTPWGTLRGLVDYTYNAAYYIFASNKSATVANAGNGLLAEFDKVPALGLINARLMLTKIPLGGPGQTDASFWVRNLADSKKMVNLIDFAFFRNAAWTPPRTFGVSLSYKW